MALIRKLALIAHDIITPALSEGERADCQKRFPRILSQQGRCWTKGQAARLYRRWTQV